MPKLTPHNLQWILKIQGCQGPRPISSKEDKDHAQPRAMRRASEAIVEKKKQKCACSRVHPLTWKYHMVSILFDLPHQKHTNMWCNPSPTHGISWNSSAEPLQVQTLYLGICSNVQTSVFPKGIDCTSFDLQGIYIYISIYVYLSIYIYMYTHMLFLENHMWDLESVTGVKLLITCW